MAYTRIKFCGITRPEDALCAAELGADAIGLVFYAASPRAVTIEQALSIVEVIPPFLSTVALFVNPSPDEVAAVLDVLAIDLLQFHGTESAALCAQFKKPYVKALQGNNADAVGGEVDGEVDSRLAIMAEHKQARAFLFDHYDPVHIGGSGKTFDWDQLPKDLPAKLSGPINRPLILAGGLDVNNVRQAITQVQPYAVDVSSGIEQSHGIKDSNKMAAFINEVRHGG